jgi:hypothetical protein
MYAFEINVFVHDKMNISRDCQLLNCTRMLSPFYMESSSIRHRTVSLNYTKPAALCDNIEFGC